MDGGVNSFLPDGSSKFRRTKRRVNSGDRARGKLGEVGQCEASGACVRVLVPAGGVIRGGSRIIKGVKMAA